MATKNQEMARIYSLYKEKTGKKEVDMHEVAKFAAGMGFPLPKPINALDRLAKEFSQMAREVVRYDKKTGNPYRANHSIVQMQGTQQLHLWIDIDEAPRPRILKSLVQRREQTVGDMLQLTFDADHWNSVNSKEEPIVIETDLTDDVQWRKNSPEEKAS